MSKISQDAQPGQDTIINAKQSGFGGFVVLHENYRDQLHFKDDAGTEFPFTCAKKICDAVHPVACVREAFGSKVLFYHLALFSYSLWC